MDRKRRMELLSYHLEQAAEIMEKEDLKYSDHKWPLAAFKPIIYSSTLRTFAAAVRNRRWSEI